MSRVRLFVTLVAALSFAAAAQSQPLTLREDFSSNPATRGWQAFGATNLFSWNSTNQNLEVTWDSSQTNSYFYHPLGRVLRSDDDFTLSFDLNLTDAVSLDSPAELGIGLLNLADATSPKFLRGTGSDSPNLIEFDYFPAPDDVSWVWGSSITAVLVDRLGVGTSNWSTNGFIGLELPTKQVLHLVLAYTGADQTLRTSIWENGVLLTTVPNAGPPPGFLGFEVDTLAIESYSDFNGYGSILAHGTVGNIIFTAAPSPVGMLAGQFDPAGNWQTRLMSATNWLYTLERTSDFIHWTPASPATAGTGDSLVLRDPIPPPASAFYRVNAARP